MVSWGSATNPSRLIIVFQTTFAEVPVLPIIGLLFVIFLLRSSQRPLLVIAVRNHSTYTGGNKLQSANPEEDRK